MRSTISILLVITLLFFSCNHEQKKEEAGKNTIDSEISFYTSDSIQIYGDLYALNKKASTILLFHQGGSNARGEYDPIIPKLLDKGFNILAIDQRSGGQVYGKYNRTLANIPSNNFGDGYSYCDAYNNLEGALNFIIESNFTGDKILWGSSYSASLAIQLASKRQDDINGVLAFSPATGGSMKNCLPNEYFETLKLPLLLLRPSSEMDNERVKEQFDLATKYNHQTYISEHGVHGSSMLVRDRVKNEVDETWNVVLAFLDNIEKR